MGVVALNKLLELDLGYDEIMYCYSFVRTKTGASYLQIRPNRNYLVTDLPDSSSGKEKHYVSISGPLIDSESAYADSFPVEFGNKASRKINRTGQLPIERKKLVHQVWQYSDRSAHILLQYTPRYKSFISQHKSDIPLSPTESSSDPEKEQVPTEEECRKDPERTLTETGKELSSSDSNKSEPVALQQTPSVKEFLQNLDNLSLSLSSDSSRTHTDNIIAIDSESSAEMERKIPSVKELLKRKAAAGTESPKDKRPKVMSTGVADGAKEKEHPVPVETGKGKDSSHPEDRPSKPKNTEIPLSKNQKSSSTEGPNKGVVIWQPKLLRSDQGASRPVLSNDTVDDPLVSLGLSDAFLLPKDRSKNHDRSTSQIRELSLSHIGHMVNGVSELFRRCMNREDLLNQASKRESMLKSELSKQVKQVKETELRLIKGSRLLTEANEELDKVKAEGKVLKKINSELKKQNEEFQKQVDEFPGKLVAEYNAGADKAVEDASIEIPELLEEKWADGFRRAWSYALQTANTDPSSDLFNRCEEALDLTRSKIIGEQALVEAGLSSYPPSPAIHASVTSELAVSGLPPKAPVIETSKDIIEEASQGKGIQTEAPASQAKPSA